MEDQDIEVVKLLFDPADDDGEDDGDGELPPLWRPMFTFGKREARASAARDLLTELRAAGRAEAELPPGLIEAAQLGPGRNDLKSFFDGMVVQERFASAADLTAGDSPNPWVTIRSVDRHGARKDALLAFIRRLEKRLGRAA